jgi:hypothetical protein
MECIGTFISLIYGFPPGKTNAKDLIAKCPDRVGPDQIKLQFFVHDSFVGH